MSWRSPSSDDGSASSFDISPSENNGASGPDPAALIPRRMEVNLGSITSASRLSNLLLIGSILLVRIGKVRLLVPFGQRFGLFAGRIIHREYCSIFLLNLAVSARVKTPGNAAEVFAVGNIQSEGLSVGRGRLPFEA